MATMFDAAGHPDPVTAKKYGAESIGQYLGGANATSLDYVKSVDAQGMGLVSIWEVGAEAALGGSAQGEADGRSAVTAAEALDQPPATGIYATCDFDAVAGQFPAVTSYFVSFAQTVRGAGYLGGAYAGTEALIAVQGKVDLAWQAAGWSHGTNLPWCHMRQSIAQVDVAGTTCDMNVTLVPNYGAWNLSGPFPKPPTPIHQENHMPVSPAISFKSGQTDVFQVSGGNLWHKWKVGTAWLNECVAGPVGGVSKATATFPDQEPKVSILASQCLVTVEDSAGRVWYFAQAVSSGSWGVNELP